LALLMIPFFALLTKLVFYKWGHNYYEHIVMNAFIQSYYTIFYILILYPLIYLVKDNQNLAMTLSMSVFLLMPIVLVWFYKGFYNERRFRSIVLKVAMLFAIIGFLYVIFSIVVAILMFISNPEALQQMRQKT